MNESDLCELWKCIAPTCVGKMSRRHDDGVIRPLTNVEMSACLQANFEERMIDRAMSIWIETFNSWVASGCPLFTREDGDDE